MEPTQLAVDENIQSQSLPARLPKPTAPARVVMPNRRQVELRPSDLESLLPEGHRARMVWGYVERQDLAGLYAGIKAVEGGAGRAPPLPPRFCLPCGCTPPWKALAVPAKLPGLPRSTTPTDGFVAASKSITTPWRTFAVSTVKSWTRY